MATYSRTQLVRDILLELGMLDPNETPTAEDSVTVDKAAQQRLEELFEDGLIPFALDGDIPARYQRPLVKVIANELVPAYGLVARAQLHDIRKDEGMRALWKLRDAYGLDSPTRAEYY